MEEIIYRRYKRLLDEEQPLPQLIVVDGGKGQLSSALKSLELLELRGKISIVGIAKKLEEIYYPDDSFPMYLDKRSETLRVIQQMRDEAHRFGITHHRTRREKGTIKTELTGIEGIGDTTAEKLLRVFKSVKKIKEAGLAELEAAIDKSKGKIDADATYAEKITADDRRLDPERTAPELERVVRALHPHIGAHVALADGSLLGVREARALSEPGPPNGSLSLAGARPVLGCREGSLELIVVVPPGRRPMPAEDFLRGYRS